MPDEPESGVVKRARRDKRHDATRYAPNSTTSDA